MHISYTSVSILFFLPATPPPLHPFYWEEVKFFKKFFTGEEVEEFSICHFFVFFVFCWLFFRGRAWAKRWGFFGRSWEKKHLPSQFCGLRWLTLLRFLHWFYWILVSFVLALIEFLLFYAYYRYYKCWQWNCDLLILIYAWLHKSVLAKLKRVA